MRLPPIAAYACLALIVFLGREFDLIHDFLIAGSADLFANPLGEFADRTAANVLVGAVWPAFFLKSPERATLVGVTAAYLALVLLFYFAGRPRRAVRPGQQAAH